MNRRWKRRPAGSNWGDFGDDDRVGMLNLLTVEKRLQGVAEVREGLAFCLSLPLNVGPGLNPSRFPPKLAAALRDGRPRLNRCSCEQHPGLTDVVCDDWVSLYTQYSTQWDSLCHVGSLFDSDEDGEAEICYYNGYPPATDVGGSPLGIEHMAGTGVQGRGVMIDLRRHFGDQRVSVGYKLLMRVLEADGVIVEPGDLVCLHTGFADLLLASWPKADHAYLSNIAAVLDGHDTQLLQWISDSRLSALIADNVAVERGPATPPSGYAGALMPLHEHCLFKRGVHLGEMWHLTPLADWLREHGRSRFLLTAPPLRLPGAVGSPVTPVATV